MAPPVLRIARPTNQLGAVAHQYMRGLGLVELGRFEDHQGFDGVMLGHPQHAWHLEFTHKHGETLTHAPLEEDLLVLYMPKREEWDQACARMQQVGFLRVAALNPYWDRDGATFQDLDGYRVVLANREWVI
jgi:hypothetical protein